MKRSQFPLDPGHVLEKFQRLRHRHVENVRDGFAFVADFEGLGVVAFAVTSLTFDVDVREEIHLQLYDPGALTRLAPSSLHVEGKTAGLITPDLGLRQKRKKIADVAEKTRVGRRIRPGRTADRALIDVDHLIDVFESLD